MSENPIDLKKGSGKGMKTPHRRKPALGSGRKRQPKPEEQQDLVQAVPGTAMKVCDTENVPVDLNARPRDKAVVKCQGRSKQTDIALKKDLACSELHMRRPNAFLSAFKTHLAPSLLTDKTLASKSPNLTRFDPSTAHSTIVTVTSTHVSGRSSITLDSSRSERLERTSLESDKLHCTSLEAVLASGCVVDDDGGVTGENLSDGMNGSDSEDDQHGFGRLVYLDDSHAIIEEDLRRVDDGKLKPIPPARPSTLASHQGSNSNPMSLRNTAATESKARDAHRLSDDTDAAVKNVGLESSKPRWTIPTQATPTPRGTREGRKGDVVGKAKGIYSGHETDRREQINYAKSTDILSHMSHGKEVKRHIKISERPVMLADDVASGEVPLDEVLEAVIDCVIEGDNLAAEMTLRALSNPFLEPDDMHSDNQVSEKKLPEANAEVDVEWVKYIDESTNMAYFHNIYTGESTWNTPEQYITHDSALPYTPAGSFSKTPPNRGRREDSDRMDNLSPPRSPRPHATPLSTPIRAKAAWIRYIDEEKNLAYYHNSVTGESTWRRPASFVIHNTAAEFTPNQSFTDLKVAEICSRISGRRVLPVAEAVQVFGIDRRYNNEQYKSHKHSSPTGASTYPKHPDTIRSRTSSMSSEESEPEDKDPGCTICSLFW